MFLYNVFENIYEKISLFHKLVIWSQVVRKYPVFYFDATSKILQNVQNQNAAFFYSIVCHDKDNKCIIPVAEFVTTCQTEMSISSYLMVIRKTIETHHGVNRGLCLPSIIVTDHSWAMINSANYTFNLCAISQYLKWSFQVIINKVEKLKNKIPTIIYICATHFLRIIIKRVKQVNIQEEVKFFFIISFTLILNSTTIEELEKNLERIYIVFHEITTSDAYLRAQLYL